MKILRYEKVGDISSKFPFLEVFREGDNEPFMEIGITTNKELCFKIYISETQIELNKEHWESILKTAKTFLPKVIKDEEDFDKFTNY